MTFGADGNSGKFLSLSVHFCPSNPPLLLSGQQALLTGKPIKIGTEAAAKILRRNFVPGIEQRRARMDKILRVARDHREPVLDGRGRDHGVTLGARVRHMQ